MKQIKEYLLSKENPKLAPESWEEKVEAAKEEAKAKGLVLKFRNKPTNAGDFTFFIYDKSVKNGYLVGYDGGWNSSTYNFDKCLELTLDYIRKYEPPIK